MIDDFIKSLTTPMKQMAVLILASEILSHTSVDKMKATEEGGWSTVI